MKPQVSAVIVNYNGKEVIGGAIKALEEQICKNIEIFVVDNNSADGSAEFIKKNFRNVKLIQNSKNLGYSGINAALKHCKGDYIFFTNNDIFLEKECIKKLVECLENDDNAGIACPKVVNYFDKTMASCGTWLSRSFYNGHFKCEKDCKKEIPYMGIGLIRKEIAEKFGYIFDSEYFIYAEDVDLGMRARLLGYKAMHIPDAVLYHMHQHTTKKSMKWKLTYVMERNLLTTFFKILSLKNIILYLPYVIGMRIAAIFKDILTLSFANAFARVAAMLAVIVKMPKVLEKRIDVQKLRIKGEDFVLEVFTEKYLFSKDKVNV